MPFRKKGLKFRQISHKKVQNIYTLVQNDCFSPFLSPVVGSNLRLVLKTLKYHSKVSRISAYTVFASLSRQLGELF